MRLHSVIAKSSVNGPGERLVIFFQGCEKKCHGCINPQTHDKNGGYLMNIDELFEFSTENSSIEGITLSGGEPFLQPKAVYEISKKAYQLGLSVIISTGLTLDELKLIPSFNKISRYVDVIIAGPYQHHERVAIGIIGSANKQIVLFSSRYSLQDFIPKRNMEIIIEKGKVIGTGTSLYDNFDWKTF